MTDWFPDRAALQRPAYLSLADQIARAINESKLPRGARLPPQRRLAEDLTLSVQTVTRAYDELIRRGLVSGEVGRGSFVLGPCQDSATPYLAERQARLIDLSILKPIGEGMHIETLREGLHWAADNLGRATALAFRPNSILPRHQHIAAEWLRKGGVEVQPSQVMITDGASSAISTAVLSAVPAGGTLAAATLTHHLLIPLCKYLGIQLEGLPQDEHGLIPDALDHAARRGAVRTVFVQPSLINPRAVLTGAARRMELVEVARRHDLTIIENDILNVLIEDRPPPFAALAPERVIHINGFTKIAMPGLRMAYLVAPEAMAAAVANRHLVTNWLATPALMEVLSHWVQNGTMDRLIGWQRNALADRHAIVRQMLPDACINAHPQSLHLWMLLPEGRQEDDVVRQLQYRGVAVASGRAFRISERGRREAIRIAVGPTEAEDLRTGLRIVRQMLQEDAEFPLPMI